jgi:predicted transcriptional regulator
MKRTTIFVDEALERDLRAIAERERRPVSGLVREALENYVARRRKEGPKLGFVAFGRSGHGDTSELHESLLWRDSGTVTSVPGSGRGRGGSQAASSSGAPPKKGRV